MQDSQQLIPGDFPIAIQIIHGESNCERILGSNVKSTNEFFSQENQSALCKIVFVTMFEIVKYFGL